MTPQWVTLLVGLLGWVLWPRPFFAQLLAAYGLAWLAVNLLSRMDAARSGRPAWRPHRVQLGLVLLLVAAVAMRVGFEQAPEFAKQEGLKGLGTQLQDRLRLEQTPSIAPPFVFADLPQTFHVHAPGAGEVSLQLSESKAQLPGTALGGGVFRVDYIPSRDGAPASASGPLDVALTVDSVPVERTLTVVTRGAHPRWFSSNPKAGIAVTVSEETDELIVVPRHGNLRRHPVGDGPVDAVLLPGGTQAVVSHRFDDGLWLVNLGDGAVVRKLTLGYFQGRMALAPGGQRLAVAVDGTRPAVHIVEVDPWTSTTVPLIEPPDWLCFGPDEESLIVSSREAHTLRRYAAADGWKPSGRKLELSRPVVTMARAPAGDVLFAAVTDHRRQPHRGNHYIQDQILRIDSNSLVIRERFLTARATPLQDHSGNVDSGASPMGIQPIAGGSLRVSFAGSDEVWTLSATTGQIRSRVRFDELPLRAPHGIADLGEGHWAVSSPAQGSIGRFGPQNTRRDVVSLLPGGTWIDPADPAGTARRQGELAFYESTRAGISCQSCHTHGDTDYAQHSIGQRKLLHTLNIRGIGGTAPYLRDASFPRISDLESVTHDLFRGYRRAMDDRGARLQDYIYGLPARPNPRLFDPENLSAERAGMAAFQKAQCTLCHAPPAFTNLSQHPVRALFPKYGQGLKPRKLLDVPSLRGLRWTPPYLHDGRAETVGQVYTKHNTSNRHGNTAVLSDAEREVLTHFLEAL